MTARSVQLVARDSPINFIYRREPSLGQVAVFLYIFRPLDNAAKSCIILKRRRMTMTQNESSRMILGLKGKGWTADEIINFILWVETGDSEYKPKNEKDKT